ncbi:DUF3137 domain-containing protein [Leptolyngbya sp. NIES-2104]|uniref:DUF3137 domain-containing protein n=1 Tax=Leptolyngbya sp. NIES-2104 TaxID=1552121 RepID=UPI00178C8B2E|nr:DUF3137 domain-containing protein [Leptolyngbya sp. NIES-2104]
MAEKDPSQTEQPASSVEQSEDLEPQEKSSGLPQRSLKEFKDFCHQRLIADLKEIEKLRKKVLSAIEISIAIFVIMIVLVLVSTPAMIDKVILPTYKYCDLTHESPHRSVGKYRDGRLVPNTYVVQECTVIHNRNWRRDGAIVVTTSLLIIGIISFLWIAFYSSSTEFYGQGFQRRIIREIVQFLDPEQNLAFTRGNNSFVLFALQKSCFFSKIDEGVYLKQNHCVAGKISHSEVVFSEIVLQKEITHSWIHSWIHNIFKYICQFSWKSKPVLSIATLIFLFLGWQNRSFLLIATLIFLLLSIVRGAPYCIGRIAKGQRIDFEHFRSEIVFNAVSRQPIFKGIFFTSDFNKTFRGKTVIVPNNLTSKVNFLNQHRGQRVKLEDPEFSKFFSVYSNDQIGARYVLSTSMMQRIVDFRKKANRDLFIALVDSQLYIAVPSEEDLFEPRLFKTMLSFNPMREYFETLQLMMSIVEDLNLNQRIWKL